MWVKRIGIFFAIAFASSSAFVLYKHFNPLDHPFFPQCPIKYATGFDCPGCGSQRAIHYALNGDFAQAFYQNQLIFVLMPYILLGFYLQLVPRPTAGELKLRQALYGSTAIKIVFAVIVLYSLFRNAYSYPMQIQ